MKRRVLLSSLALLIVMRGLIFVFWFSDIPVKVNNTDPVEQIATKRYGIEKQMLARAIFDVRSGFEDVSVFDLAREVGIRLECKRQVSENQFYYVVPGYYHCFLIVDEKDIVQEVLTIWEFLTIAQTKEWMDEHDGVYLADALEYRFYGNWKNIGTSSVYMRTLFTLRDGVMIMESKGNPQYAKYYFFTNDEWEKVYEDWAGFLILPMDKE